MGDSELFWLSNSGCLAHRCACCAAAAMTAAGERTSERENGADILAEQENGANILAAWHEWGTLAQRYPPIYALFKEFNQLVNTFTEFTRLLQMLRVARICFRATRTRAS